MARLSRQGAKRLLALTILSILAYGAGALTHSEIMHFFGELFGIE
jgi:hypothetical protein